MEKDWYTVINGYGGKYRTILKNKKEWEKLGYKCIEKEKEVILVKDEPVRTDIEKRNSI
jgi:hypothetical protein